MSKAPFKVLVFPGSTEIGLEIHRALQNLKEVEVHGAGIAGSNHGPYVYSNWHIVPSIFEPDYFDKLVAVILREKIDFVFPAYDDVIVALGERRGELGAKLVTSPQMTCETARYKSKTYEALKSVVNVPRIYSSVSEILDFPVFAKPDRGQGSQGAGLVRDLNQALELQRANKEYLFLEYLPGREFTVDCFSDRERGLLFCGGRERHRMRSGIAMDSNPVNDPRFQEIAKKILTQLEFHGAWFFQVKENSQRDLVLLEVAPRIAGTMAVHRVLGVNFPLLSIYEQLRMPIQVLINGNEVSIDRALVNRYRHNLEFNTVYCDLDDMLIVSGKINCQLVAFLYQCLNSKKKLVLVTKHAEDLQLTLARYRIQNLFDEIIHLRKDQEKADFIDAQGAIFIDDSFSERKRIATRHRIPTFDSSMLELLLDDRG